eukprot:gene9049-18740_t
MRYIDLISEYSMNNKELLLCQLFLANSKDHEAVIAHLDSKSTSPDVLASKVVYFCVNCPNPKMEGSFVYGLSAKYGINKYSVTAEIVYGIPNFGEKKKMTNRNIMRDRIVFVDRGVVTLQEKAVNIQNNGAIGLIIADDGQCDEKFTHCGSRVGSLAEGGIAANDSPEYWSDIQIPVLLISLSSAEKIRKMMNIQQIEIPGLGLQNITTAIHARYGEL